MRADTMSKRSENRFSAYLDADLKEHLDALPDGRANDFVNQAIREKLEGRQLEPAVMEMRIKGLELAIMHLTAQVESLQRQENDRLRKERKA